MSKHLLIADDDPVIRLVRVSLADPANVDADWVRTYFAPEEGDPLERLRRLPAEAGLTGAWTVTVGSNGSEEELLASVAEADVLCFRRAQVTARVIAAGRRLRLIQRLGARPEGIDLAAAQRAGIPVCCVPRRSLGLTAEHALLLMLALAKRLPEAHRAVAEGRWAAERVQSINNVSYNWAGLTGIDGLYGRTLGIIGMGEVGSLLAQRARACEMSVLYHNRRPVAGEVGAFARLVSLDELLTGSDFVVLLARDAPENVGMMGAAQFARMRPGAYFVNVSRGRLVDETALLAALQAGQLAGAGLDVHRVEPRPAGDPLAALPNLILTPHLAGGSRYKLLDEVRVMLANAAAAMNGGPLRFRSEPEVGGHG